MTTWLIINDEGHGGLQLLYLRARTYRWQIIAYL